MTKVFAASLLLAGALMAQTTTTTTSTRQTTFPPVGLGSTETLQVNLANTATAATGGNAASCVGTVSFLSSTGATIGSATSFTIASAQLTSVRLPFASAGLTGNRGVVRVVISLTRTSGVPCNLVYSLETFETSSGATHIYTTQGSDSGGGFGGR
jgi:hypothetical protein